MKNKYLFIYIIICILTLSSCIAKPQAKPKIKPKIKIGVVLAETKTDRNQLIEASLKELADQQNLKLVTTEANLDPLQQKKHIEKMIKEKVKAVILQPVDTLLTKDYITMLQEKSIKVVLIDGLPPDISVDAYIAPDYLRGGELQGQFILDENNEKKILILKGDKQNNISDIILQGNINILKNNLLVKKLDIVEVKDWEQKNAYEILKKIKLNKDDYTAIITHYEEIALGVNKYFKEFNLHDSINLTSIGLSKDYFKAINVSDKISGVDTLPHLLSQFALKAALSLIKTNSWEFDLQIKNGLANVPAKLIPVRLITQDNLYLLQDRFGKVTEEQNEIKKKTTESENTAEKSEKQTKLKVKTKDGKELEVTIPGEIKVLKCHHKRIKLRLKKNLQP